MLKNPLIQEWVQDPLYQKAVWLWVEYYNAIEAFDTRTCVGRGREGFALPTTPWERTTCSNHAKDCFDILSIYIQKLGISDELVELARDEGLYLHEANWPKGEPYSRIR